MTRQLFQVKVGYNKLLAELVEDRLIELGYRWMDAVDLDRKTFNSYCMWDDNTITYNTTTEMPTHYGVTVPLDNLLFTDKWRVKKKFKVKLNADYEAEVTKDGIVVGCQTFTFEKLEELYLKVREFHNFIN